MRDKPLDTGNQPRSAPPDWRERTRLLTGENGLERLAQAHVAVFGLGGVGGHCAEALCRAGVGRLTLVDGDVVTFGNINRQLCALRSTVGQSKALVMKTRLLDINPDCDIDARAVYFNQNTASSFDFSGMDHVLDCVDDVPAKLLLIKSAKAANVPILCCMGTGNRLDARFEITDIGNTGGCPLARVMRKELRRQGITGVMALYDKECALAPQPTDAEDLPDIDSGAAVAAAPSRPVPGSIACVPPAAGLMMAGHAIRALLNAAIAAPHR